MKYNFQIKQPWKNPIKYTDYNSATAHIALNKYSINIYFYSPMLNNNSCHAMQIVVCNEKQQQAPSIILLDHNFYNIQQSISNKIKENQKCETNSFIKPNTTKKILLNKSTLYIIKTILINLYGI